MNSFCGKLNWTQDNLKLFCFCFLFSKCPTFFCGFKISRKIMLLSQHLSDAYTVCSGAPEFTGAQLMLENVVFTRARSWNAVLPS